MGDLVYKKRPGTSGISGQLYETKLTSFILYKAMHDEDIEDFYIGTNLDDLGVFDDICFRVKVKGFQKQLAVFLQAKHKDDHNKVFTLKMTELAKYFYSFMNIKNKFNSNADKGLFKCKYEDVECVLVYYTTTRDNLLKHRHVNYYANKLNDLISTDGEGAQLQYGAEEVMFSSKLILREEIKELAQILVKYYRNGQKNSQMLMNEQLIQKYHVILADHVFEISLSKHQAYRSGIFRNEFFHTDNENLIVLKHFLCSEMILTQEKLAIRQNTDFYISLFLNSKSVYTLSKIIGNVVKFNKNSERLEFIDRSIADDLKSQLQNIPVTPSMIGEAMEMAGVPLLQSMTFNFHYSFGNNDLTLRGNNTKIEKRLQYLADNIRVLLENSRIKIIGNKHLKVVELNENYGDTGFLKINGGIGGAVGNLLVIDVETRLLKFQDKNVLNGFAYMLYKQIENIDNLEQYRFDIQIDYFPKLLFNNNTRDKNLSSEFLNSLLFYTNQAKEDMVENILKQMINSRFQQFQVKSDAIFLKYHDSIQKWWMNKSIAQYLTKQNNMLDNVSNDLLEDPLLCLTNMYYNNIVNKMDLVYNIEVVKLMRLNPKERATVMVTEAVPMTIIKITQYFKGQNCRVLDLNYISSLPTKDCNRILNALSMTKSSDPIILACSNSIEIRTPEQTNVLDALQKSKIIIVTNVTALQKIQPYLRVKYCEVIDECNLTDLTERSQENVIKHARVVFQGVNVNLDLLLDAKSKSFIKGYHINKIILNEAIQLGSPLADPRYEDMKNYFVLRSITKNKIYTKDNEGELEEDSDIEIDQGGSLSNTSDNLISERIMLYTLYDIPDQNIVITAGPGMGKSSLLTHLAVQTKANYPSIWIVRLNLLDYSRHFLAWQQNKVDIGLINSMKLICKSLIKEPSVNSNDDIDLYIMNDEILLNNDNKNISDCSRLELNLFLNFYNNYQVQFLFDGFDEICPHYENEVLKFLKVMKYSNEHKHRIVITSRTYNNIQHLLTNEFELFKLNYLYFEQHQIFLEKFLDTKLNLNDLSLEQLEKLNNFVTFIQQSYTWEKDKELFTVSKCQTLPLVNVYLDVVNYYQKQIKHVIYVQNKEKYLKLWKVDVFLIKTCKQFNGRLSDKNSMRKLITTPLHLFIMADHFQSEIRNTKIDTKWNVNFNSHLLYERFLETKLKNIRFEDKNKMDLSIPDVRFTFERERKEFITVHKRLAAYAYFHEKDYPLLFNERDISQIKTMIQSIKSGEEKTGVVCSVVNDIPKFVHFSFTEYFAASYFCDVLKQEKCYDKLVSLWDFVINSMFFNYNIGLVNVMDDKFMVDDELKAITSEEHNRKIIAKLLLEQSVGHMEYVDKFTLDDVFLEKVIRSSLSIVITENLKNCLWLFTVSLEHNVNSDNLQSFIKIFAETSILQDAVFSKQEFIGAILNIVRKIDESKLKYLFHNNIRCYINCNNSNDCIINNISEYLRNKYSSMVNYNSDYDY